mmetsp:Transcript_13548/g.47352  ORF Transcript_13548/g.47352 Transcript_13548/m.47352 type:complete len:571 (-) Transcript_13548:1496-3208(-)
MAWAVRSLSPVSIQTSRSSRMARSVWMALLASDRIMSAMATTATTHPSRPWKATSRGASAASLSASAGADTATWAKTTVIAAVSQAQAWASVSAATGARSDAMRSRVPTWTVRSVAPLAAPARRTTARTPLPTSASKSRRIHSCTAVSEPSLVTARAKGCSDPDSVTASTSARSAFNSSPDGAAAPAGVASGPAESAAAAGFAAARVARSACASTRSQAATRGWPTVRVPVLSKTTQSTECAISSARPPLIKTPCVAPRPVPTMTAVGVARPRAQGHATTTTETPKSMAKRSGLDSSSQSCGMAPEQARVYHATNVEKLNATINGVNLAATTSAYSWIGAFESCASSTRRAICASVDSEPTLDARMKNMAPVAVADPKTASPRRLRTGRDSPVSAASSTKASPTVDSTTPSQGTAAPGSTLRTSPGCSASQCTGCASRASTASSNAAVSRCSAAASPLDSDLPRLGEGLAGPSASAVEENSIAFGENFASVERWSASFVAALRTSAPSKSSAVVGCIRSKAAIAPDVRCLALASRYLPKETKQKSMALVSNMMCSWAVSKVQHAIMLKTE